MTHGNEMKSLCQCVEIVLLIECRRVGFLDNNPAARSKVIVESRAGSREREIEGRIVIIPLLERQPCVLASALDLDIFIQPAVAEEFAAIIDEDAVARREVNEKSAKEIFVEAR